MKHRFVVTLIVSPLFFPESQTNSTFWLGIRHLVLDQKDQETDEYIRHLCLKATQARSDKELNAALDELREAIRESMSRARERVTDFAILEGQSRLIH